MITPSLNTDGFTGHILIEPNRPVSWQVNIRFIKIFALISFIISTVSMYHGFLLVMPFSGLEVIVVFVCLHYVYKRYSICQVIYFTSNRIVIESGKNSAEKHIEYQRHWSKFHIDKRLNYTIPQLFICSKGKSTEIGDFLGFEDKLILIDLIKKITTNFISQPIK